RQHLTAGQAVIDAPGELVGVAGLVGELHQVIGEAGLIRIAPEGPELEGGFADELAAQVLIEAIVRDDGARRIEGIAQLNLAVEEGGEVALPERIERNGG